jgi:hypothetical protein
LDNNEVQQPMKILSHTQPIQSQIMGKFIVKKQKKGSIAISNCQIEQEIKNILFLFSFRRMCS